MQFVQWPLADHQSMMTVHAAMNLKTALQLARDGEQASQSLVLITMSHLKRHTVGLLHYGPADAIKITIHAVLAASQPTMIKEIAHAF